MVNIGSNGSIASKAKIADMLASEISRKSKGDFMSWDWLSSVAGRDLTENRDILAQARAKLVAQYKLVLSSVPGKGYLLCTDELVVEGVLPRERECRRRAAKRAGRKVAAVDMSQLSESQQLKCLGEAAIASVTEHASSCESKSKAVAALGGASTPLALNAALRALIK